MESANNMLCSNGCGFYGSAQNLNLCSKCFKEYQKKEQERCKPIITPSKLNSSTTLFFSTDDESNGYSSETATKNWCKSCNKRVGLMGFKCRCGGVFCRSHRYPEEHACSIDFKAIGREILIKQNPLIKSDKLQHRI